MKNFCFVNCILFLILICACDFETKEFFRLPLLQSLAEIDSVETDVKPITTEKERSLVIDSFPKEYIHFHDHLSDEFDFKTKLRTDSLGEFNYPSSLRIDLLKKGSKKVVQYISLDSLELFGNVHYRSSKTRSYSTHFKENELMPDGYAGDLIIADFNFDEEEDLAVLTRTSNAGFFYSYFLQQNGRFHYHANLTDIVSDFPQEFISYKKQLIVWNRAGAMCSARTVFQMDSSSQEFREKSHLFFCYEKPDTTLVTEKRNHKMPEGNEAIRQILKFDNPNHVYQWGEWIEEKSDAEYINYLGIIKTDSGKEYKLVSYKWLWGITSPRATSRIYIYSKKNKYVGYYYLENTNCLPYRLKENNLYFFTNKNRDHYWEAPISIVNFSKGIPKLLIVGGVLFANFES